MDRSSEHIELSVPLRKQYARMVRLLVGAVAQQHDFDIDRLDDVKLAAEEAFLLALGLAQEPTPVCITLLPEDDVLRIRMSGILPGHEESENPEDVRAWRYGLFVLNAVADEAHITNQDGETVLEIAMYRGGEARE